MGIYYTRIFTKRIYRPSRKCFRIIGFSFPPSREPLVTCLSKAIMCVLLHDYSQFAHDTIVYSLNSLTQSSLLSSADMRLWRRTRENARVSEGRVAAASDSASASAPPVLLLRRLLICETHNLFSDSASARVEANAALLFVGDPRLRFCHCVFCSLLSVL